jgi:nucleoside-diphosphate kinase
MVLEGGDDAVALIRQIVGKTDPSKADKGTIRGDFGEDSFEAADKEGRSVYNLIHASGNDEEAALEVNLWFPNLA